MYKIALCDDDKEMLSIINHRLKKVFAAKNIENQIDLYDDSMEMKKAIDEEKKYDAYFLDIDMPFVNGMELAAILYDKDVQNDIIFITDRVDLVFEAIHYRPFRFIRKNRLAEEAEEAVTSLLYKKGRENTICTFSACRGSDVKLMVKDIEYIESSGHYLKVYTKEEIYKVRGKISAYEEMLSDHFFVRIYNTILVNVRYVYSVSLKGVILDDDKMLPVSRKNLRNIKEKHMEYMRRYINGNC